MRYTPHTDATSRSEALDDEENDHDLTSLSEGSDVDYNSKLRIQIKSSALQQKIDSRMRLPRESSTKSVQSLPTLTTITTTTSRRPGYLLNSERRLSDTRDRRRSTIWDSLSKVDDDGEADLWLSSSMNSAEPLPRLTNQTKVLKGVTARHTATSACAGDEGTDGCENGKKSTKTARRGALLVHPGSRSDRAVLDAAANYATRSVRSESFQTSPTLLDTPTRKEKNNNNNNKPHHERYPRRGNITQYSLEETTMNDQEPEHHKCVSHEQEIVSSPSISAARRGSDIVGQEECTRFKEEGLCLNHRTTKRRGSVTAFSLDPATVQSVIASADLDLDVDDDEPLRCSNPSTRRASTRGRRGSVTRYSFDSTTAGLVGMIKEAKGVGGEGSPLKPPLPPADSSLKTHRCRDHVHSHTIVVPIPSQPARRRHSVTKYSLEMQQPNSSSTTTHSHEYDECAAGHYDTTESQLAVPMRTIPSASHGKAARAFSLGGKKFDRRGSVTRYSLDGSENAAVAAAATEAAISLARAVVAA
jgi:hypothetical protein